MDEKKKKKLLKAIEEGKITDETTLGVFQLVEDTKEEIDIKISDLKTEVNDAVKQVKESEVNLDKVLESIKGKDGKDGESVTGDTGEKGDKGDKGDIGVGKDGKDGKDGRDGRDGRDGANGKDADETIVIEKIEQDLPKLGEKIRDGLELLPEGEKLTIESIENLRKELDELKRLSARFNSGISGIGARDLVKDIDISDQLDGIKTTFNIQAVWNIFQVSLSSYPYGALRKGIDYTWTPTSVTFTSEIDPAMQLSTGQKCILTVVQG